MRYIILIGGFATSGKDFMADILCRKNFFKLSFAESLKVLVSSKYKINYELTQTQAGKLVKVKNNSSLFNNSCMYTVRDLLIYEAALQKCIDNDIFVKHVMNRIMTTTSNIVISDFRFANEYYYIKQAFMYDNNTRVISLKIDRYNKSPVDSVSEYLLKDFKFDCDIWNRGTISEFKREIKSFMDILGI